MECLLAREFSTRSRSALPIRRGGYAQVMSDPEPIDRVVWTDADFETMGWHDAVVHALGFQHEDDAAHLLLDLDYIFRWIDPQPPSEYYSFLIAPATLVFEDVWDLEGDLTAENAGERTQLVIADLRRGEPEDAKQASLGLRRWTIDGHNFELTFLASGYRQHIRQKPIHVVDAQRLTTTQRGGISFDQPSG
jgi:hypothetical protein